ncbi:MAG TPA: MG2 domain-containing protein, partial [Candidatus Competibacteraceae bacterium]|nr:MG2 domain-containing protein [Candidatus Competibacteraceae bacterium]
MKIIITLLLWLIVPPVLAQAPTAPQVDHFSPQGTVKPVRQVTARFSAPMVALGDPRLTDPFLIDCAAKGKGRWVDSRNWVYDFETDLESGIRCQFTLRADLRTLAGEPLSDLHPFSFDTGGPKIRATLPGEDSDTVDEQQVFLLASDGPVIVDSIKAHTRCEIKGIAEPIEVDVIAGEERERLLAPQRGTDNYTYLLREDYTERLEGEALRQAEERLVLLRCRRAIPPATGMSLVWGAGIAAPGGIATAQEQRLNFTSRPAFTASLQCERLNAHRPCLPMRPLRLVFSAPIAAELAKDIRLVGENGKDYRDQSPDSGKVPYRRSLIFKGPFPEKACFRLELPPHLVDDANRPLENAARFPLEVTTDEYPPLAKFSGEFGILEAREGGILPVTLRNLESEVAGEKLQVTSAGGQVIAGKFKRVTEDNQQVFQWLRRVEEAMASRGDWEEVPGGESRWKERTGDRSVFQNTSGAVAFNLPKAEGAKAFEVVGIPLKEPGFYVVELASPTLGEALLGERKPRYVATAALVTNLAVHFKQGRESSLVWVTHLDDGQPVEGAAIRIGDPCQGKRLWEDVTGKDGIARIDAELPALDKERGDCRAVYMVSARTAEDMSFVLSDWNKGIAPDDFNLKIGSTETEVLAHTVFDRALFRAGETVSMKYFIRRHSIQGIERTTTGLPDRVRIVHLGSGQEYSLPLALDGGGIGESRWEIPRDAKLGSYRVTLEGAGDLRYDAGTFRVEQFRLPTMKAVL